MNHSPGAPVRLTPEQQEQLKRTIVESVPHEVGFRALHNWTLEISLIISSGSLVLPIRFVAFPHFQNDAPSRAQLHQAYLYLGSGRSRQTTAICTNHLYPCSVTTKPKKSV
ncbi:hypothetical protein [Paenibacillus agricola]|uniref:hypothetical protein n=1 Tax=Paenibacillus agricola TaxID=2716264 RepID=UPI001FB7BFED|nr:hypothetical protein [Paenibacillus agricola]